MTSPGSLVSVVIPTRARPHLVTRSVCSALTQSLTRIEVIVVIDGPDDRTLRVLRQIDDPRLRVKTLPRNLGLADARNTGVSEARGQWIAFLDDDDEWFSEKLKIQLQTAEKSTHRYPIVTCRLIARTEVKDFVWPRRLPLQNEPLSEYLFCRNSPFFGEGLVASNTIFTAKELLRSVPFRSDLQRHEDLDWLLRASALEGVGVEFVPSADPLAIWHMQQNRSRMSNDTDWRYSVSWIRSNRHLVTSRAYASFIMTWIGANVSRSREWSAFFPLIREAFRRGKPSLIDALSYFGYWLTRPGVRGRMVGLSTRRRSESEKNGAAPANP